MAYSTVPLPASPTLTNPDMILPYGEYEASPPASPGSQWRGNDMDFSIGSSHTNMGLMTPTTPIIYGNGTMLSDIGEVTEAESTPGRKLPGPAERRLLKQQASGRNTPIRSSPTMGYQAATKRTKPASHQRKVSIESNSTVNDGQTAKIFEDFDDGISIDDSVFQGDDEESVADSYSEEIIASETQRLSKAESNIGGEEDINSSAALSRRAEQILLNAKKRLNNMEGNLTRARSSLYITPSGTLSSIHSSSPLSRSTPSPAENEPRIQAQLGVLPSIHRQIHTPLDSPAGSPGHSRVSSENSVPKRNTLFPIRASSAASRYITKDESSPKSPNFVHTPESRSGTSSRKTSPPHAIVLEPLDEDEAVPEFDGRRLSIQSGTEDPDHRGLTRSASSMQMRDLQHQMQDLKGRLSVLRDRARDDTMKRRSMQSLRTPSPFTAAEQWYSGAKTYGESLSTDAGVAHPIIKGADEPLSPTSPKQPNYAPSESNSIYEDVESHHGTDILMSIEPKIEEEEEEEDDGYDTALEPDSGDSHQKGLENDYNEEIVDRDEADEDYESDASLYHDTMVSHEDREDAFDYEHFFLHSAMGTISQQRNRRDSFSSECSVETTRGPAAEPTNYQAVLQRSDRASMGHFRSESTDTVSTMATFATATENFGLENDNQIEKLDAKFAVQYAQAPVTSVSQSNSAKRSTFGPFAKNGIPEDRELDLEAVGRRGSVIYDKDYQNGHNLQRPSVGSFESFESTGTTRSFPLVNRPKAHSTSTTSSNPDLRLRGKDSSILSDSPTLAGVGAFSNRLQSSPVDMLAREDQILVERLVASVGKCVLGLQEAGRASAEGRVWRRRLDAARRVLEGWEGAV